MEETSSESSAPISNQEPAYLEGLGESTIESKKAQQSRIHSQENKKPYLAPGGCREKRTRHETCKTH
jgi:hypothetical protein